MLKVITTSGAVYRFNDDLSQVCREPLVTELRRDREWINLLGDVKVTVGKPMRLELEPLDSRADVTLRITTPVTSIEEEPCT